MGRFCSPSSQRRGKVRFTDITCETQQRLRQKCYPQDIREQIEGLTSHINNHDQRQQLQGVL